MEIHRKEESFLFVRVKQKATALRSNQGVPAYSLQVGYRREENKNAMSR